MNLKSPFLESPRQPRWQAGVTRHSHLFLPTLDGIPMPLAIAADPTEGYIDCYVMVGNRVDRDAFGRPKTIRRFGIVKIVCAPEFRRRANGQSLPHSRDPQPPAAHAGARRESQMPRLPQRRGSLSGSSGRRALALDPRTRGAVFLPSRPGIFVCP